MIKKLLSKLFSKRPTVLNWLHKLYLVDPASQTIDIELSEILKYSAGKKKVLEIGSYMGKTSVAIAEVISEIGEIYCVDPWESKNGKINPMLKIFNREFKRKKLLHKVVIIQEYSTKPNIVIPKNLDLVFIDGDHSFEGLKNDWNLVERFLIKGGIVCLHDTTVPNNEPWRQFGSVDFYNRHILTNPCFKHLSQIHSLNILEKIG